MMVVALTVATGVMVVVFGSQISCFSEPTNLFFFVVLYYKIFLLLFFRFPITTVWHWKLKC